MQGGHVTEGVQVRELQSLFRSLTELGQSKMGDIPTDRVNPSPKVLREELLSNLEYDSCCSALSWGEEDCCR